AAFYSRTVRVAVGLLFVVLAATAAQSTAGRARQARAPVLLTYVAAKGGLCALRADGSRPQRLTPRRRSLARPAWAPPGRYVAFSRVSGLGGTGIFVADARGKIRWRFGAGKNNGTPLWSPDGAHIAYFAAWAHSYSLNVAAKDGSHDGTVAPDGG